MSNFQALFPAAVVSWTDRRDQLDIVFAADPNSLAAEIIAIENTLGVMPQVEKNPISGNPVTYASVDARISAVQQAQQLPVVALRQQNIFIGSDEAPGGALNTYQTLFDPFKMYNGNDVTLPVNGWYVISAHQQWDWWDSGWCRHGVYINGTGLLDETFVRFDLEGNVDGGKWWHRNQSASVFWQGPLGAGTRVSVYSENGTSDDDHRVVYMTLHVACTTRLAAAIPTSF